MRCSKCGGRVLNSTCMDCGRWESAHGEQPAFVVMTEDNIYKIYRSGRVEGFDSPAVIINRISVELSEDNHGINPHRD